MVADLISGREALHRLDEAVRSAREAFDSAVGGAEAFKERRANLARLRADGYRELARLRVDAIREGVDAQLTATEARAAELMEQHADFLERLDLEAAAAAEALKAAEDARREGEAAVDAALAAYEAQVEATEASLETDPAYAALQDAWEEAQAVVVRAGQKLELAKADRTEKGAPYESDPLFAYLWDRRFRTADYREGGLIRMLDNWVAKVCNYDAAWMNYARLTELPDRLSEHLARMKLEEAEAQAAIERYEAQKLVDDGAGVLSDALAAARAKLAALDAKAAEAEARTSGLRRRREEAATGRGGPYEEACRVIEEGLKAASFPDLRVLAAETTTLEDDRIVDVLVKLRTEELQMESSGRSVDQLPARRRATLEALEAVRRRFRAAGLDSPFVGVLAPAFEAAVAAYSREGSLDSQSMWRAITATVRSAPRKDDRYFGGRKRRDAISIPDDIDDLGDVASVVLNEVIREVVRGGTRGRWGGGGPWGGSGGGSSSGKSGGSSRPRSGGSGGRIGGGGFRTGGRVGGGGFKTRGRF